MRWYHATPFTFTTLRKGSWIATDKTECFNQLMLKNCGDQKPYQTGLVVWFDLDMDYVINVTDIGDGLLYAQTNIDVHLNPECRENFTDYVSMLSPSKRAFFNPSYVMDLKPLLVA